MTEVQIINVLAPQQLWVSRVAEWSRSLWSLPLEIVQTGFNVTASFLIVRPLAWLYLEGPVALGFWGGLQAQDICAQLTHTHANFWLSTPATQYECMQTIQRHFWSWLIFGSMILYFLIFLCVMTSCFTYWKFYIYSKFTRAQVIGGVTTRYNTYGCNEPKEAVIL